MQFWKTDLKCAKPTDLATVVKSLHSVEFTQITGDQLDCMLRTVANSPTDLTLDKLSLPGIDLSHIPSHILTGAMCKLKTLSLINAKLTNDQTFDILSTIANTANISLTSLEIYYINCSHVSGHIIAKSVCKLNIVNMGYIKMTPDQANLLLDSMSKSENLHTINLSANNLSCVHGQILGKLVSRLSSVDLGGSRIKTDQLTELLNAIAVTKEVKLHNLGLAGNDLSNVPVPMLTKAV